MQVVCAETDAEAQRLAAPSALSFVKLRQGRPELLPSPEETDAYPYSDFERGAIRLNGTDIAHWPQKRLDGIRGAVVSLIPQDPGSSLNPAASRPLSSTIVATLASISAWNRNARRPAACFMASRWYGSSTASTALTISSGATM